ncbi:MAG: type III pantothenate kinase, partial [Acidimicrobiia bacterium]
MLLAIDVGNTQTVLGLFDDKAVRDALRAHWRISTEESRTADELALILRQLVDSAGFRIEEVRSVALCSVVPKVTASLRAVCAKHLGVDPLVLAPGVKSGMPILYDNPKEVGADRVANGVAAYEEYGGPAIVVDFGTATTFDAISKDGEYLGGAIAPGIEVASRALFDAAAGLRRVELVAPRQAIGRNTTESLQSGIVFGVAGQVDSMIERIRNELDGDVVTIATGGLAPLVISHCKLVQHHDAFLTLKGLVII